MFKLSQIFQSPINKVDMFIFILLRFEYKSILASGFSQPQITANYFDKNIKKKKKVVYLWDDIWEMD